MDQATIAVKQLPGLIDHIVSSTLLLDRAFEVASRLDHSIYDCAYLACALRLDTQLLTADLRFADKARQGGFGTSIRTLIEHPTT